MASLGLLLKRYKRRRSDRGGSKKNMWSPKNGWFWGDSCFGMLFGVLLDVRSSARLMVRVLWGCCAVCNRWHAFCHLEFLLPFFCSCFLFFGGGRGGGGGLFHHAFTILAPTSSASAFASFGGAAEPQNLHPHLCLASCPLT